ncbi:hypothetical protein RRG08_007148, partial [Elysia crispata]
MFGSDWRITRSRHPPPPFLPHQTLPVGGNYTTGIPPQHPTL